MIKTSWLRRSYDAIALFAVLNLLFLGGLGGLLVANGAITRETLPKFAAVVRGADVVQPIEKESVPTDQQDVQMKTDPMPFAPESAQVDMEIYRREADRIQAELRQRLALNNSILLRITTERQAFQREQDASEEQAEAARRLKQTRGFEKQVAILEGINPSMAVKHLLRLENPDEAAELLLSMDDRKAKRVVDAAKNPDQQRRINQILQRMKEASERKASAP